MNYTLHQLQVFLKIAELKSVTKAAEALHLTQPAVSIQLKNFQDQFEIPLTEIIGRRLFVTEFGQEIAHAAANILEEVYAINYKALAHKGLLSGKLKVSVVSTGKYVMPHLLSNFMQRHDSIELSMDVTNKAKVIQSLEENSVDFALMSILPEKTEVEYIRLMENHLVLVGKTDPFFGEKQLPVAMSELPLIFREEGSGTRVLMENFIQEHNIPVKPRMELTSNEAVKQALMAGLGYSIMPMIGIRNELNLNQLAIVPMEGLPKIGHWYLTWLKSKKLSPVATAFKNYLEQEKPAILSGYPEISPGAKI